MDSKSPGFGLGKDGGLQGEVEDYDWDTDTASWPKTNKKCQHVLGTHFIEGAMYDWYTCTKCGESIAKEKHE